MDFKEISQKWQKKWKDTWIYTVKEDANKPKFYILDMFPYPSGAWLHVGHPKWFMASDCLARKKMLEGFSVLHPMWFDTFGLGTENYAIEHKMKPQVVAKKNIETYIKQLEMFGCNYDRDRSLSTADPEYFKWTQWIFLKLYESYYNEEENKAMSIGSLRAKFESWALSVEWDVEEYLNKQRLAYIDYKPINRCPKCKTGLANEDLDDGKCERCGSDVEQKPMKQRVLRITKYAQRLIDWLDKLDRDESMKELERNWIGKSEWTQFKMNIKDSEDTFEVYTTRIDTVFGMSFVVMAPEHPLVDTITTVEQKQAVESYKEQAKYKTQLERTELQKDKSGQFTWSYAINPFNGEEVPIYIADYVLANYGTWVVMAVPAHDERDFEFAKKYDIKITQSIMPDSFDTKNPPRPDKKYTERNTVHVIIRNPKDNTFLVQYLKGDMRWDLEPKNFVIGGIEDGESELEAAIREVKEETGYTNITFVKKIPFEIQANFFAAHKDVNRKIRVNTLLFDLAWDERVEITEDEHFTKDSHEHHRIPYDKVAETINIIDDQTSREYFCKDGFAYTEKWVLINSQDFTGMTSDEAIAGMQKWLKEKWIGGKKMNYKIQDRVFSRQRYRGEPFPVVFCDHCDSKWTIHFYNQDTWNGIKTGTKTVETRALNPEEPDRFFGNYKEWDIITAVNKETNDTLRLKILHTYQWKNLKDMWENGYKETIEKMYWNKETFKEAKDFESFATKWDFKEWYLEKIENNGIIWREIQVISPKVVPMKESDLPLLLPDVENYEPTGTEEWPLADVEEWIHVDCPVCGRKAKRESNTMPGRAWSSWYRMRYMDNKNDKELVSKERDAYWKNVDVYIWWAEHVTRHMIYARFWQKFLFDLWVVSQDEPFLEYHSVWLIMGEDGRKMSKRRGNVVNPDDIINEHGTDTLRAYEMFMGPFDQSIAWSTNGIKWVKKFLEKIVALKDKITNGEETPATQIILHQSIKKLTEDIDAFRFNTGVSQLMIFVNHLTECPSISRKTFEDLVVLVSPFAPHLAEELWESLGNEYSIFTKATWPSYDEKYLVADTVTIAVQVNGKVRGTLNIAKEAEETEVMQLARENEKIAPRIAGESKKIIYVKWKILNIVV